MDASGNIVYSDITTNEEGLAVIDKVLPGKYYIQEIKAPEGYTLYKDLIEIDIELNQKYTVNVNNYENQKMKKKKLK